MGRPRKIAAPVFERRDAAAAVAFIRRNRRRLGDPHLGELPVDEFVDDEVVDAVLAYCHRYRRVGGMVVAEEVRARATLWAYREQRLQGAARRRRAEQLGILEDGHVSDRSAAWYAGPFGFTSQNEHMRRQQLRREAAQGDQADEVVRLSALSEWVVAHREGLAELAELLAAHRPAVLAVLLDEGERDAVAELVDEVGAALVSVPDVELAERLVAAVRAWQQARRTELVDPVVREFAARGSWLVARYRLYLEALAEVVGAEPDELRG